jgi:alkylation response protein AidB-like acyl-CoA dehydrogenase
MTFHSVETGGVPIPDLSALGTALRDRPRGADAPFPREAWAAIAETGLFGELVDASRTPAERMTRTLAALERLGETCEDGGFGFSVVTHIASTVSSLSQFGTPEARARFLPDLIAGRLVGAHAISEPEAGSDALAMRARAVRDGDAYVLTAEKAFVTNGPIADVVVVYAKTGAGDGVGDVSAFLVPTDLPGVRPGPAMSKVGLVTSPLGTLSLEGVRVPASHRLGREGSGFFILSWVMKREILLAFMVQVGEMRRRIERCVRFVNERRQFGATIGSFQSVSNRIADMRIRYELSRAYLLQAAENLTSSKDATTDIAVAKVFVSEAAIATALDALHIHGGKGFLAETGLGAALCDAVAGTIYSGTNDIQRGRIAAMMGVKQ